MDSVFKLGINETPITQVFYREGQPWTVERNTVVDMSILSTPNYHLRPVGNFLEEMDKKGVKDFYLERIFSLGDLLMVIPVIRHLNQLGYDPYLRTTASLTELMGHMGVKSLFVERSRFSEEYGLILDGTVERDHIIRKLRTQHRVYTYMDILGIKEYPKVLDWSCDISEFEAIDDEFLSEPYIVFQGKGSTPKKQLSTEGIEQIIKHLNDDGIRVVYIHDSSFPRSFDTEMTKFMCRQANIVQLFSLIGNAKALISMDSSPLWISHFTKTPIVLLLGPSRPEERITLHPLYPEKAVAIELNKEINCESCFECSHACNSQINCLKIKPERIYELMREKLIDFWRKDGE